MWHSFVRRLLVKCRLIPQPELVGRPIDCHPTPQELEPGALFIVQDNGHQKWACFRCPGGCGEKLQLSLNPSRRPKWTIALDWLSRPTVTPSVHQLNSCGCHFWIQRGAISWCIGGRRRRS